MHRLVWINIIFLLCVSSNAIMSETEADKEQRSSDTHASGEGPSRNEGRSLSDGASGSSTPVFKSFKFHDIDIHYQELLPDALGGWTRTCHAINDLT